LKRISAILFLFVFLSANTAFGQLLKLPALIQHYQLHISSNEDHDHDNDFLDFIKDHYNSAYAQGVPSHDHHSLPFKYNDCAGASLVLILPLYSSPVIDVLNIQIDKHKIPLSQKDYSSTCSGNIWQPPRLG